MSTEATRNQTASASLVLRGRILHFLDDPCREGDEAVASFEDGILVVEDGHVSACGPAEDLLPTLPAGLNVEHRPGSLIMPGFIDTHVHYPQTEMVAAHGEQLLAWLNEYTYPTEMKFADAGYAAQIAEVFLDELLRNGTTTALVFGTVHAASVDAFFAACQQRQLRMIAGKVLMDRHAPEELCDTAETGYQESRQLIERWHGKDRLQYAVTPRFAPTCSEQQLARAGQLLKEHEGLYLHTHLAESKAECTWVQSLFPGTPDYLHVYDSAELLGRRSVFAHGLHLSRSEVQRLADTRSAIAHCPTSNLFLGSGLIDLDTLQAHGVHVGLGTDIGAGTSFSLLRTMDEAYKVQQLRGSSLDPLQSFYLATLGGARALDLENTIGSFRTGNEADFVVLDPGATPLLQFRLAYCRTLRERLFVLATLGDDRLVARTYSRGRCVYSKPGIRETDT